MPAYLASFLGGLFNVVNAGSASQRFQHGASQTGEPGFRRHLLRVDPDQQFRQSRRLFPERHVVPPDLIIIALKLIPVIAVFSWLGSRIVARCPPALFRNLVFLLILAMCAKTLSSAF